MLEFFGSTTTSQIVNMLSAIAVVVLLFAALLYSIRGQREPARREPAYRTTAPQAPTQTKLPETEEKTQEVAEPKTEPQRTAREPFIYIPKDAEKQIAKQMKSLGRKAREVSDAAKQMMKTADILAELPDEEAKDTLLQTISEMVKGLENTAKWYDEKIAELEEVRTRKTSEKYTLGQRWKDTQAKLREITEESNSKEMTGGRIPYGTIPEALEQVTRTLELYKQRIDAQKTSGEDTAKAEKAYEKYKTKFEKLKKMFKQSSA